MPPASPAAPITNSAQALAAINQAQGSQVTADQAMQDANQAAGIPQQQQQVSGLRGAINNTTNLLAQVAPSVMGRTANSLVTSAQADQQINNAQAPLNDQLNKENTDYAGANSDLTNAEQQAEAKANAVLSNQSSSLAALQDLYKTLSANEQTAASQAEAAREFNATPHGTASTGGLDLSGLLGGDTNSTAATPAPADFAKGTTPQAAIAQLFTGYNPSVDKGYTETTVLPAVARLLQLNNPTESQDVINSAANNLVYNYRKANFGE